MFKEKDGNCLSTIIYHSPMVVLHLRLFVDFEYRKFYDVFGTFL